MNPGILEPNRVLCEYQLAEILGFKQDFESLKSFLEKLDVKPVLFGKAAFYPTTPIVIAFERAAQGVWVAAKDGKHQLVPKPVDPWITKTEAADLICVSEKTIDRHARNGKIVRKYINKLPRFLKSSVEAILIESKPE